MSDTTPSIASILPDIAETSALLQANSLPLPAFHLNAHIHLPPNFSAFDNVAQAVQLASEQGVQVLGASNYYDYYVYTDFARLAKEKGIFPLFGLEIITLIDELVAGNIKINDPGNPGKMYICGKGITRFAPMNSTAEALMGVIRDNDSRRMETIAHKLADLFAGSGIETGLDASAIKKRIVARHGCPLGTVYLQERHLAQAFQEVFYEKVALPERAGRLEALFGVASKGGESRSVTLQNEIRSHLMKAGKAAFVPDTFVDFDHAYRLILALGGIPCYPTLADGTSPICPYEADVEALIADMKARGVYSAEFIPIRNTPEVLSHYVKTMRAAGIFVTAGTEHNTLDLIPIEPTCLGGVPVPEEIMEIFREGACVLAAHQLLTLRGEPGFVDTGGNPNSSFASVEERIKAFHKIGASVLRACILQ